jgi:hypothetical protein
MTPRTFNYVLADSMLNVIEKVLFVGSVCKIGKSVIGRISVEMPRNDAFRFRTHKGIQDDAVHESDYSPSVSVKGNSEMTARIRSRPKIGPVCTARTLAVDETFHASVV